MNTIFSTKLNFLLFWSRKVHKVTILLSFALVVFMFGDLNAQTKVMSYRTSTVLATPSNYMGILGHNSTPGWRFPNPIYDYNNARGVIDLTSTCTPQKSKLVLHTKLNNFPLIHKI